MPVPRFPSSEEAQHQEGFLHAADGLRLYWQRYAPLPPRAPRATVAVLHGGGDHSGRYPGVTAALVQAGFEVALVDFRGHGQSDGRRWHVDAFADYLSDLEAFMAKVREGATGRKLFVLGHSQGGLIAASWGLGTGRGVAGFVLSSPWLQLAFRPPALKLFASLLAGRVVPFLSVNADLDLADLTSDDEMQRWTDRDPLYGRATTPRWFTESTRAQEQVRRRAPEFAYPLLVLLGSADRIAAPDAGRDFLAAAGSKDKRLEVYEGFRHELFNEVGRERPIADTVAWIAARSGDTGGETI
jgi:alpha-beta hydrolase superfamily lysophospholipase